ncbi:unnamed protein product [Malus baccata var. baccata]
MTCNFNIVLFWFDNFDLVRRILVWPKGNKVNSKMQFSMYLSIPSASTLEPGWTRFAHFSLSVLNQLDSNKTITKFTKGSYKEFKEHSSEWGFRSFMLLSELYDETAGYLVNDTCIVEVKVHIPIDQRANSSAVSALMQSIKKEHVGQERSHVHSVQTVESSPTPITPSSEPLTPFQETSGPEQVCAKAIIKSLPDPSLVKEFGEVPTKPTGGVKELGEVTTKPTGEVKVKELGEVPTKPTGEVKVKELGEVPTKPMGEVKVKELGEVPTKPTGEVKELEDVPTKPAGEVKELAEVPTEPTGELMDFRGLGLIEKAFVPLLEEACTVHLSLIECVRKKNRKVIECALTTLGGLLHFLKTKKVKDMNEDAFAQLRSLWEDVEMFRFDLGWLEPRVQSALGKKKFLEMARRVKRLRDDVEVLDNEKKRRSAALAVTEVELEEAKRELAKEEEGFNEKDMDSELAVVS